MDANYSESLANLLKTVLPQDIEFELIHVRSLPQKCRKLVFTSKNDKRLDALTTHYFILTHKNVSILSLELLTYESSDYFTIFVSKADTTGHYRDPAKLSILHITQALLRVIIRYFSPGNKRIRIALFAMAQNQYLFLGSEKNPKKHVLTDAQLVSWWTKCLDELNSEALSSAPFKAFLSIPGLDQSTQAIAKYFPANARLAWAAGDIFWEGEKPEDDYEKLAVKRIPRFPDDPKSRFLDSIVADKRGKKVSKRQFWLELESRQEFRLGKSVGIIGIEFQADPELHHDFSRLPAMNQKETHRFKDLLLSLNFETLENTEYATKKLLRSVNDAYKLQIKGSQPILKRAHHETTRINTINTLNAGLVRKKQKKS